jgi:adenylate cyclase, class 2
MITMDHDEIEVKYYLKDLEAVRDRIMELGAVSLGRVFETNVRYEDNEKTLIRKKQLLRLRHDGKTTLTFKTKPSQKDRKRDKDKENDGFKVLRELEVEVNDFDTMNAILGLLGFQKEQVYEKWRETFTIADTCFCLDSMPYGDFLEIEGERDAIVKYSDKIGFLEKDRILDNYLALFEKVKEKFDLSFSDVTFDNFKNLDIDPSILFRSGI